MRQQQIPKEPDLGREIEKCLVTCKGEKTDPYHLLHHETVTEEGGQGEEFHNGERKGWT